MSFIQDSLHLHETIGGLFKEICSPHKKYDKERTALQLGG